MPWERRDRPAPYVKNSAAAGTASSGCWGAGAPRLRGARLGAWTGSCQGAERGAPGPGVRVPFSESESQLAQPAALVVSPLIRAGFLSGATQPSGPQVGRTLTPGMRVRGPPRPRPAAGTTRPPAPPCRRRANSAPTCRSWRRAARAVTSAWGGVQGPRPAAAGCSRLYHRLGARPLRPVPPRRPAAPAGEEPRPRPVQPRPSGTAPGSPPRGLGR